MGTWRDLPWVPTVWMPKDIGWHTVRDYSSLDRFGLDDAANQQTFGVKRDPHLISTWLLVLIVFIVGVAIALALTWSAR